MHLVNGRPFIIFPIHFQHCNMPAWITIYLQEPLASLEMADIKKGVAASDWLSLGESMDIEDEDAQAFMDAVQWRKSPLEIGLEGQRPLQIHLWNTADRLQEEIAEIMDEVEVPTRVAAHLPHVKAIVALEFGIPQMGTMIEVIGFEVAYWLAETKNGLILAPEDDWFDASDHRWDPIEDDLH